MASPLQSDFKSYQEAVAAALVNVTKNANTISSYDLSFHRSLNPNVSKSLDGPNTHLLRLTSKLLKAATRETSLRSPNLRTQDDVEDSWRSIIDVIDDQLEKADASLDEVNGLVKRQSPAPASTPEPPTALAAQAQPKSRNNNNYRYGSSNMPKPQQFFHHKVDNFQTGSWKPLLKEKPHAKIPLTESLGSHETGYQHPYKHEIETYDYPSRVYKITEPVPFTDPDQSQPIWVDTKHGVQQMLSELKQAKEIAIDLEHNNNNSYVGMTCLMQISVRNKDWIVDTLVPWREDLQCLNEVFTDPDIVKILHGSTSDMIWLQRDLGLYVVGLFDTFHASEVLSYEHRSLAYLLKRFAHFDAQKQFQLADWRIRPLPQDLIDYARSDTHYLLYVFDCIRNELVEKSTSEDNLVKYVLDQSKKEALQVYERHSYDKENGLGSDGWLKLFLSRSVKTLDKAGFGVFRALHEWRDKRAREMDDGVHLILPNNYIWNCAEFKPDTKAQLFDPRRLGRTPAYVVGNQDVQQEIIDTIRRGKKEGLNGPSVQEVIDRNADAISTFRNFKHPKNRPPKPPVAQQSMAMTMQELVRKGDIDQSEPIAVRNNASALFGPMPLTTAKAQHDPDITLATAKILMPMPIVQTQIPAQPAIKDTVTTPIVPSPTTEESMLTPQSDSPFVLRDLKKKRGADQLEDDINDMDISESNDLTTARELKAARKARKAAEKAAQEAAEANYTPFDYDNAPSVLNGAKSNPGQANTNPNKTNPMNPFAKALDTSTGARRGRFGKEMAGKSHTFTS